MQNKITIGRMLCFVAAALLAGVLSGCLKDTAADCPADTLTFTVRAYDGSENEVGESDVSSVFLYYFDANRLYVGSRSARVGEKVALDVSPGEELHIVAWGNLNENTTTVTGDHVNEFGVGLPERTRAAYHAVSPDDIFWGTISVSPENYPTGGKGLELPIRRQVGSLTVTVKGLRQYAGFDDDDYYFVVGETPSRITFEGTYTGDRVTYLEQGIFRGDGELYYVAPFNLIPEEGIYIDIFHGVELIARVAHLGDMEPITVVKGELTNVYIDMSRTGETGAINVRATLTDWGSEQVWKEF